MPDVINVDAKTIDQEVTVLSKSEKWLADAAERVSACCEQYKPPERIESDKQRKECVESRTSVRKDAAIIDNEREAMLRDAEDALKRFKSNVKDVLTPLTDLDAEYKRLLDEYEEQWRTQRVIELTEEYEGIAPDLVELVPFDRLMARFGSDKGKVWTNRSVNIVAAKEMVGNAVMTIADAEQTIREQVPDEDVQDTLLAYFQSLDLQRALSDARHKREQRENLARLEAERAEREAQWAAMNAEQASVAEDAVPERPSAVPVQDVVHPYVFVSSGATKAQVLRFRDLAREAGIPIDCAYVGTLQEVYERVVLNAR